jgi:SET domain-containing protein
MFLALRTPLPPFTLSTSPSPAKNDSAGETVYAARAYRPGDVVFRFDDVEWRQQRDCDTVEHPGGGHVFNFMLARTAHSCEPNCCISFPTNSMAAIRPINAGEAITCDYESTETWFSHPFWCQCGSRRCRGRIG